jgi:hypothetical protein
VTRGASSVDIALFKKLKVESGCQLAINAVTFENVRAITTVPVLGHIRTFDLLPSGVGTRQRSKRYRPRAHAPEQVLEIEGFGNQWANFKVPT